MLVSVGLEPQESHLRVTQELCQKRVSVRHVLCARPFLQTSHGGLGGFDTLKWKSEEEQREEEQRNAAMPALRRPLENTPAHSPPPDLLQRHNDGLEIMEAQVNVLRLLQARAGSV